MTHREGTVRSTFKGRSETVEATHTLPMVGGGGRRGRSASGRCVGLAVVNWLLKGLGNDKKEVKEVKS